MELSYWQSRWNKGHIGFHLPEPHHSLENHLKPFLKENGTVYMPLCGKSPDMIWFANQNWQVIGTEISEIAIRDFFQEQLREAIVSSSPKITQWTSERICIRQADFFHDAPQLIETADLVFDRGALVAMPPEKRKMYADLSQAVLRPGAFYFLVSFTYRQQEMNGPPFSVPFEEVSTLFPEFRMVDQWQRPILDSLVKFKDRGLSAMSEECYLMQKMY